MVTHFLHLIQALEGYYRAIHGDKKVPLQEILEHICDKLACNHDDLIYALIGDTKNFAKTAANTRHNHSHSLSKPIPNALTPGAEMHRYILKMKILLQMCILTELGLPAVKIDEFVKRNRQNRLVI